MMAISPDGILGKHKELLSDEDEATVAKIEDEIDDFLNLNYSEQNPLVTFYICDPVSLPVLYEVIKRFRDAGWKTYVSPGDNRDYSRPGISFFKSNEPIANENIIRSTGKPS